jgi:hypothetical protein
MALDQHAANLVTTTVNAFNGDATSISPFDGISLINSWIAALKDSDQNTESVAGGLNELKTELQSGNPDGARIQQLLSYMVSQAREVASSAENDVKTKLNPLIEALQGFSQQLGGSEKMAAMNIDPSDSVMPGESGGQAPMTSTVGGESTTSGTGASSLRDDEQGDPLSNRNGGTMDSGSAPTVDSDAMLGSEGAERQDGGSYGSGYGTGSDGDDYSSNSGTQRSGISGGTAESGSVSSGGRSQY